MVFPTNTASASVSLETQDYSQRGSGSRAVNPLFFHDRAILIGLQHRIQRSVNRRSHARLSSTPDDRALQGLDLDTFSLVQIVEQRLPCRRRQRAHVPV